MSKKKASLEAIKALRGKTSASINDVRAALESSDGDEAKALAWLRKQGAQMAEKRQGRETSQGRVESYVHHDGRIGALVEVDCETDFVARTPEFIQFCRDLAMHIAAMNPRYVLPEDIPAGEGRDAETLKSRCLLEQPFVKDQSLTVNELLKSVMAKTGENVVIRRFEKFAVGESANPSA
ncbi:MAG: elongation factor Ts [Candidatus Omnitrophica bacterium]|nr:elongation factor Ts [Candidatus Omnitrophota bacterium]